jgi:ubiquinone/menaquinone biosynthesis C-methylase UbiE
MITTNHQKFENPNPIQKFLIGRFHHQISEAIAGLQPGNLLELGCGEGFFLNALKKRLPDLPVLGLDYSDEALVNGKKVFPNLPLEKGDIYKIAQPDASWDVVVASEVLEHLEHPDEALRELRRVTKRYVVLSVPHEPWFRLSNLARGRNIKRLGNHPEHINLWSASAFKGFVGEFLTVERVISSFPWTIVVAHR